MQISDSIRCAGVDDSTLDLFEGQYEVPYGVTYNSYVILDEKTAIMDTVDPRGMGDWLININRILDDRTPDYLVVQHLEPDHSGGIETLAEMYPDMKIVLSVKAAAMLPQFTTRDIKNDIVAVKEGDTLSLGKHALHFIMAPMVHWPEVMMTYEDSEKVLFSADGFGTFGTSESKIDWIDEARRYYINIVGKYGPSVQAVLKKAAGLEIKTIAPLHGPVLNDNLSYYIDKYDKWSSYLPEKKGVLILYASAHGNTKEAALYLKNLLEEKGEEVKALDLNRDSMSRAVEYAFMYDRLVLASITYDGELFPAMEDLIYHLRCKSFKNRKVGFIENGSWAPMAAKKMKAGLEGLKDIEFLEPVITIKSKRHDSDDQSFQALRDALLTD